MSRILDITQENADRFSTGTVQAKHRFLESGLFEDDALAELIEGYPEEHMSIHTTTLNPDGVETWRHGSMKGRTGADVIEAIKHGKLWINLQHMEDVAPRYHALVARALDDVTEKNPSLKHMRHNTGILISSPSARVLYHCDISPVVLCHIRGAKRLWLYPNTDEFISNNSREQVVLRETEEEVPYSEDMDAHAQVFDLKPGDLLSWEMQAPHRVDNIEGLNVSMTTAYYTPEAMKQYGVIYGNGVLRRLFGMNPKSVDTKGLAAMIKCGLAFAVKKTGVLEANEREFVTTFEVDPTQELGYVEFEGHRA
ncbi:hypothetical protein BN1012_Phect3112 [Candidatus Phaeomarinobacter ectocarpi]|uniref:Cupin-like domain-containing protein n=1 Tax=Candidatus Phaeomarinibacter ectocarpi TaxID=1458461 RepID=X5MHP7_9HYPH|nr:cupin-like domain-containing protein [Candidatus Phaeomarinobacter ectocarpi]CDO61324.1 hypothetical protein BN1012_Phect3112 [Candidatus Phaeomarinobacter ectocarpi]